MHSKIYHIANEKDANVSVSSSDYETISKINNSFDYVGEDLEMGKEMMEENATYLQNILPSFINITVDGTITIAKDATRQYKAWFKKHVKNIRKWQDNEMKKGLNIYKLREIDICTESENEEEWELIDSIFNISIYGTNQLSAYFETIGELALYHQGETLYIVGCTDYHF